MEALFSEKEIAMFRLGKNLLPEDMKIYIFGSGFTGNALLKRLRRAKRNAVCFIENNPHAHGKKIAGLQVVKPESLAADLPGNACVVIAVSKPWAYEIVK